MTATPNDLPPDPDADGLLEVPTVHQPSQHPGLDEEDARAADAPYLEGDDASPV